MGGRSGATLGPHTPALPPTRKPQSHLPRSITALTRLGRTRKAHPTLLPPYTLWRAGNSHCRVCVDFLPVTPRGVSSTVTAEQPRRAQGAQASQPMSYWSDPVGQSGQCSVRRAPEVREGGDWRWGRCRGARRGLGKASRMMRSERGGEGVIVHWAVEEAKKGNVVRRTSTCKGTEACLSFRT